jgi:hypothetical protein
MHELTLHLTPQAGDFMSVFQRVKFPLTWLVERSRYAAEKAKIVCTTYTLQYWRCLKEYCNEHQRPNPF